MTRRKLQITTRSIDREYRHQVEIQQPPSGFGKLLNVMSAWAKDRLGSRPHAAGPDYGKTSVRMGDGPEFIRWCFRRPEDADAFQAEFGGRRLTVHVEDILRPYAYAYDDGSPALKPGLHLPPHDK